MAGPNSGRGQLPLSRLRRDSKRTCRKAPSGLRSTKVTTPALDDSDEAFGVEDSTRPTKKEKKVFLRILDMEDEATLKIYTN